MSPPMRWDFLQKWRKRHAGWLSGVGLCALVVVLLFAYAYRPTGKRAGEGADLGRSVHEGWSYRWSEADAWTPMTVFPQWLDNGDHGPRILWQRLLLPELPDDDQQLLLEGVWQQFEVYEDGRRIYHFGTLDGPGGPTHFPGHPWHTLKLGRADSGKALVFRILSDDKYIGLYEGVRLGHPDENLAYMLHRDFLEIVLSCLFIVLGLASILVYSRRLVEPVTVHYGLFSLSIGSYELARVGMKQVLLHAPLFWTYVEMTSLYMVPITWCLFAESLLGAGPLKLFRRIWQSYAVFLGVVHVLALTTGMTLYRPLAVFEYSFMVIVPPVLASVTYLAWKGNDDARALITGATVSACAAIHDMLRSLGVLPYDPEVNHLGMCFLVLSLAFIAGRRYLNALEVRRNLELASAVQNLLLPQHRSGNVGSYAYATFYESHDSLSGDWLNVWGEGEELRLLFGDVLGKGPRAALAVAAIAAFIEDAKKAGDSLETCIAKVNSGLARLFAGEMTTTLTAARLQPGGDVELFNCGGVGWLRVGSTDTEFLAMPSTPLGLAGGAPPRVARRQLATASGDMLLAFSDGVLEGSRALAKLTETLNGTQDFEALFSGTLKLGVVANRGDDRSMVALRRTAG